MDVSPGRKFFRNIITRNLFSFYTFSLICKGYFLKVLYKGPICNQKFSLVICEMALKISYFEYDIFYSHFHVSF